MTFGEFVAFYGLTRSEGWCCATSATPTGRCGRPCRTSMRTDELNDLIEWLGAVVRQTDSSLLDEWEQLTTRTGGRGGGARVLPPTPEGDHRQRAGVHRAGAQRDVPAGGAGRR